MSLKNGKREKICLDFVNAWIFLCSTVSTLFAIRIAFTLHSNVCPVLFLLIFLVFEYFFYFSATIKCQAWNEVEIKEKSGRIFFAPKTNTIAKMMKHKLEPIRKYERRCAFYVHVRQRKIINFMKLSMCFLGFFFLCLSILQFFKRSFVPCVLYVFFFSYLLDQQSCLIRS